MEKQTNKQRDRQRNKHKPYLNAVLKLNLCRDEKQHVAGAVDVRTDKETDKETDKRTHK
jgi:hypothetical protein